MAHIKCGGECPLYPAPPRPFINCYHFAKLLRTEAIYLVCAFLMPKEENGRKKDGKTGQPVPVICVPEDGLYVILTGGRDKIQALRLCKEQTFVWARCHFSLLKSAFVFTAFGDMKIEISVSLKEFTERFSTEAGGGMQLTRYN